MHFIRTFVVAGLVAGLLSSEAKAQRREMPPSLEFGGAQVSLGMTVEQVQKSLAESARHIDFLGDKRTAVVRLNNAPIPTGDEGQVTFFDGHAVYASFQFPEAHGAVELAQELAGAIESMETKTCTVGNFSSHGTGGGTTQTHLDCGPKTIIVMTIDVLGNSERSTQVEITIGAISKSTI